MPKVDLIAYLTQKASIIQSRAGVREIINLSAKTQMYSRPDLYRVGSATLTVIVASFDWIPYMLSANLPTDLDVFVSHATADDPIITQIAKKLTDAGITTWVDHQRLTPGNNWDRGIQDALNDCRAGLFILSSRSVESDECQNEWRTILRLKKPLFVALIDQVSNERYPYRLQTNQYVGLSDPATFDANIQKLIDALHGNPTLIAIAPGATLMRAPSGSFPYAARDLPLIGRNADITERGYSSPVGFAARRKSSDCDPRLRRGWQDTPRRRDRLYR